MIFIADVCPPPPQSGARRLKRLIWLKYYFLLKRQNTFGLRLNTAKNTHQFKKKILEYEILYEKVSGRTCLPPPRVELGTSKDEYVSNILLY